MPAGSMRVGTLTAWSDSNPAKSFARRALSVIDVAAFKEAKFGAALPSLHMGWTASPEDPGEVMNQPERSLCAVK